MNFEKKVESLMPSLSKRAKVVVEHLLKHGKISTYDLENIYKYSHPPRAIRDVKESGIPINKTMEQNPITNKKMAVYRFGDIDDFRNDLLKGRKNFPKKFKEELYSQYGYKCGICNGSYTSRDLQIDHKVPFEIIGDKNDENFLALHKYMPICPSDNRKKSFTCEHCENWNNIKSERICFECYWANPENYTHIAMREEKRISLIFKNENIKLYDELLKESSYVNEEVSEYIINQLKYDE
ncbi:HNH endonuclease [Staphylococcus arlettae]|uniref:HNH endonuclease n=1 Tax=Staphylococcus arlettae TaxID=29378 RepID=UPI000D1AED24|nr:HNH endonuclease signature motif containing protein [Staphylococcus arlettae]PTH34756.1 HNH endonuclease [Staphylococcus arlettae]RIM60479.1 HNH endonuclease [Staphylococcus arlettae]